MKYPKELFTIKDNSIYLTKSPNNSTYIYYFNAKENEQALCDLVLKSLLGYIPKDNYFLSDQNLDISRSVYLRTKVEVLFSGSTLDELNQKMINAKLAFNRYKIHYLKTVDGVNYKERMAALRLIGFAIEGTFAISEPAIEFALLKTQDIWYFGYYTHNDDSWKNRKHKPYNYSHAFDVKLAKTIINIAIGNDFSLKIIDPCCGIGTVVIEGRMIGANITGYEINPLIAEHCNENLKYFGFNPDIKNQDMHNIKEHFDVAILDIPYGHFSLTTLEEQTNLICKSRDIADKVVIISMEEISQLIQASSLVIKDQCTIIKSNAFRRYLYVCTNKKG
ncbi:MAG: SAM-dependent methyltransferase [Bacilli bacterium]|nr:SAM-dependent methyltransferase [Bacilli bacterium]